jgi:hypothetical protein
MASQQKRGTCRCCHAEHQPSADRYVGSMVYPYTYGPIFNCRQCDSSYLLVCWEIPDEMLLVDDQLAATSSERDTRAA